MFSTNTLPNAEISIERLDTTTRDFYPVAVLQEFNRVSCKSLVPSRRGPRRTHHDQRPVSIRQVLWACSKFNLLHLACEHDFAFTQNDGTAYMQHLPAVEELIMEKCEWVYSPTFATMFWNWESISQLTLIDVEIVAFLSIVPAYKVSQ